MKRLIYLVIVFLFLIVISCSDDDTNVTVIGKWKLTQVLADPGDGSGVFMDVDSNKTITFFSDSTFVSSGNMCDMFDTSQTESSGSFSSNRLTIDNCEIFAGFMHTYLMDNETLEVYYPCFEPCTEKYMKIE